MTSPRKGGTMSSRTFTVLAIVGILGYLAWRYPDLVQPALLAIAVLPVIDGRLDP